MTAAVIGELGSIEENPGISTVFVEHQSIGKGVEGPISNQVARLHELGSSKSKETAEFNYRFHNVLFKNSSQRTAANTLSDAFRLSRKSVSVVHKRTNRFASGVVSE